MVPEDSDHSDHPPVNQRRKGREGAGTRSKKQPAGKKNAKEPCVPKPEDLPEDVKCMYPEWQKFLELYPMINSIQREDFPDHGVSFVYVAHLYHTDNTAEESFLSQKEFEHFFKDIGYEYNYSGNFESRWYEGIGVKIN
jgi:hypothetical protein